MPSKKKSHGSDDQGGFEYKKDEKVLVLPKQHGEDIYEAKVLDRKLDKSKAPQYKIHYKGWNKRWDEWVNQQRLLKINASNRQTMSETNSQNKLLQQQQQLQNGTSSSHRNNNGHNSSSNDSESNHSKSPSPHNNHSGGKRKRRAPKGGGSISTNDNNAAKRRKLSHSRNDASDGMSTDNDNDNDNDDENDNININSNNNKDKTTKGGGGGLGGGNDTDNSNQPLEISLPTALKRKLITDWENITKKQLLIDLPRKNGQKISEILHDFESFAIEQGQDKNIVYEISRGIKDYFNQALQVTLLYKLERKQYEKIKNKHSNLSMDQIYGVEHLCRLFVKLPQLLSPTDLDHDTRIILKDQIECIITFVLSHENKYFNTKYIQSNNT